MSKKENEDLEKILLGDKKTFKEQKNEAYQSSQQKANLLSRIFFLWILPLIKVRNFFTMFSFENDNLKLGNKMPLKHQHLEELSHDYKAEFHFKKFSKYFEVYKISSKQPLMRTLISTFNKTIFMSLFLAFIDCLLVMTTPLLIKFIISFASHEREDNTKGILLICGIIVSKIIMSILQTHASFGFTSLGYDLTNILGVALFSKSLRFSLISTDEYKVGGLINMLQVDAQRLQNLCRHLSNMLFLPLQLIIGFFIMYYSIGVAFLFGLGVLIIMVIINFCIGQQQLRLQKLQMKAKDERMKTSTEILGAMKFIKSNAWEEYFYDKLDSKRQLELTYTKKRFKRGTISIFSLYLTPNLIINATFAAFVLLGHTMTAENAFTVISIFSILQSPIRVIPTMMNFFIETYVAVKRVEQFLLSKEIDLSIFQQNYNLSDQHAIKIKNGYFIWRDQTEKPPQRPDTTRDSFSSQTTSSSQTQSQFTEINSSVSLEEKLNPCITKGFEQQAGLLDENEVKQLQKNNEDKEYILKDININIPLGSFVAFIGEVGSGKSSFLQSLVGEMKHSSSRIPSIEIKGDLSMVNQKPWIRNATVKENILFGKEFDQKKYQECIQYSCLQSDLKVLPDGDMTQIGEKGVNLSGGQKARISLARSLYSDSSILILDDILSAVDAHVGKSIVRDCLLKYKKHTTRVLATHALHFLKYMDYIYIFKEGRIVEEGEYSKISKSNLFQEIYHQYMKDHENETSTGIIIEESQIEELTIDIEDQSETTESIIIDKVDQEKTLALKVSRKNSDTSIIIDQPKTISEVTETVPNKIIEPLSIENFHSNTNKNHQTNIEIQQPKLISNVEKSKPNEDFQILKEDRKKGEISFEIFKLVMNLNGGICFSISLIIFMTLWILCKMAISMWIAYWAESNDPDNNFYYLGIFSLLSVLYGIVAMIRGAICLFSNVEASRSLHRSMISSLIFAPLTEFFERVPLGRLLNVLSKDMQLIDTDLGYSIGNYMVGVFSIILDVILCVYTSSYLIIIPIIIFIISCKKISDYYMTAQREMIRLETVSRSPIISFFAESLSGLQTIRAFNKQEDFMKIHCENIDENKKCQFNSLALESWFNQNLTFLSLIVNCFAIFFCIFLSENNPSITGLLLTYAFSLNLNVQYAIKTRNILEKNLVSLERCHQITQVKPETGYNSYLRDRTNIKKSQKKDSLPNWPNKGIIEFQNLSLKYRPNLPIVIKNIQVNINSCEKIGVVGRTGAGKSTITLSLLRILEAFEGKVIIDGIDISQIRLDQLRQKITIILQDPQLFDGTLRDNIDPLNQFTDETIKQTLNQCQLQKFVLSSQGLDMKISEGGENLSVGEKQLVCIARALLKKSKIILIDEATANIDVQTDHLIQQTIAKVFKECTVLTIAHRLNTIMSSDRILVLNFGEISEFDTPSNLLNNPQSAFYSLHKESMKENKI